MNIVLVCLFVLLGREGIAEVCNGPFPENQGSIMLRSIQHKLHEKGMTEETGVLSPDIISHPEIIAERLQHKPPGDTTWVIERGPTH